MLVLAGDAVVLILAVRGLDLELGARAVCSLGFSSHCNSLGEKGA